MDHPGHEFRLAFFGFRAGDVARGIGAGVAQDSGNGAALEFTVKRHDQGNDMVWVPKSDMAFALPYGDPAELAKGRNQLRAGDDREPAAQAGNGSLRRTTPISRDLPSSRIPST